MEAWEKKDLGDSQDSAGISVTASPFQVSNHIWLLAHVGHLEVSALGKRLMLLKLVVEFPWFKYLIHFVLRCPLEQWSQPRNPADSLLTLRRSLDRDSLM